jgi:hypothetical protein
MTRRWSLSVTCGFLEELPEGLRSVRVLLLQDLRETTSEIWWELIERLEQPLQELFCARTVHARLLGEEQIDG